MECGDEIPFRMCHVTFTYSVQWLSQEAEPIGQHSAAHVHLLKQARNRYGHLWVCLRSLSRHHESDVVVSDVGIPRHRP